MKIIKGTEHPEEFQKPLDEIARARDGIITDIVKACPEMLNADIVKLANQLLSKVCVKADDQSLPENDFTRNYTYEQAQQDMLDAGFMRIVSPPEGSKE